jgi:hypothetical protein
MRSSIRIFVVAAIVMGAMGLMASALAQTGGSAEQPEQVLPNRINQPGGDNEVLPEFFSGPAERPSTAPAPAALPFTGADLALFVGAGFLAIAGGAALVRRSRRRGIEA